MYSAGVPAAIYRNLNLLNMYYFYQDPARLRCGLAVILYIRP